MDIDKLIREGLELVGEPEMPGLVLAKADGARSQTLHFSAAPSSSAHVATMPITSSLTAPVEMVGTAPVAFSNVSAGTSGSNAFEETDGAFNFGPELSGPDSWAAFSLTNEWLDMGHLPSDGAT